MCNLYRMTRSIDEVAVLFAAIAEVGGNTAAEVFPGYPGWVVAEGRVRTMTWGFPLAMTGKGGRVLKPKPINNARVDKLDGGFWRPSFLARRCLIPVTAFAEAEGEAGRKTRTWFSLPDAPIFACAGVWRPTAEWGAAYTMVMTEACVHIGPVHDRMPVILAPEDHTTWLSGSPDEALTLCRPWEGPVTVEPTAERWAGGSVVPRADVLL